MWMMKMLGKKSWILHCNAKQKQISRFKRKRYIAVFIRDSLLSGRLWPLRSHFIRCSRSLQLNCDAVAVLSRQYFSRQRWWVINVAMSLTLALKPQHLKTVKSLSFFLLLTITLFRKEFKRRHGAVHDLKLCLYRGKCWSFCKFTAVTQCHCC